MYAEWRHDLLIHSNLHCIQMRLFQSSVTVGCGFLYEHPEFRRVIGIVETDTTGIRPVSLSRSYIAANLPFYQSGNSSLKFNFRSLGRHFYSLSTPSWPWLPVCIK